MSYHRWLFKLLDQRLGQTRGAIGSPDMEHSLGELICVLDEMIDLCLVDTAAIRWKRGVSRCYLRPQYYATLPADRKVNDGARPGPTQ